MAFNCGSRDWEKTTHEGDSSEVPEDDHETPSRLMIIGERKGLGPEIMGLLLVVHVPCLWNTFFPFGARHIISM